MKLKSIMLLSASFTMAVSAQDTKEETSPSEAKPAIEETDTAEASKIATSIAPVVKKLKDGEYATTELEGSPDYYIVYFTASW